MLISNAVNVLTLKSSFWIPLTWKTFMYDASSMFFGSVWRPRFTSKSATIKIIREIPSLKPVTKKKLFNHAFWWHFLLFDWNRINANGKKNCGISDLFRRRSWREWPTKSTGRDTEAGCALSLFRKDWGLLVAYLSAEWMEILLVSSSFYRPMLCRGVSAAWQKKCQQDQEKGDEQVFKGLNRV